MGVSINQAINNVLSDRYDKTKLFLYVICNVIAIAVPLYVFCFIFPVGRGGIGGGPLAGAVVMAYMFAIIPLFILLLIFYITFVFSLSLAYYTISVHNAILGKKSVFPSFKDIKSFSKCFIFIIIFICILNLSLLRYIKYSLFIFLLILFIIIPLFCYFCIDLKIKSLFNIGKAIKAIRTNFKDILVFISYIFLMMILLLPLCPLIFYNAYLGSCIIAIVFSLFSVVTIDLFAQLTRIIFPPKKRPAKAIQNSGQPTVVETGNSEDKEMPTIDSPSDNQENN